MHTAQFDWEPKDRPLECPKKPMVYGMVLSIVIPILSVVIPILSTVQ